MCQFARTCSIHRSANDLDFESYFHQFIRQEFKINEPKQKKMNKIIKYRTTTTISTTTVTTTNEEEEEVVVEVVEIIKVTIQKLVKLVVKHFEKSNLNVLNMKEMSSLF